MESIPPFRIEFDAAAQHDLRSLPPEIQKQLIKAIEKLGNDPYAGNTRQLAGYEHVYRLRSGDYRIIYTVENGTLVILIVAVGPRKNIYSILKRRAGSG